MFFKGQASVKKKKKNRVFKIDRNTRILFKFESQYDSISL